MGAVVTPERASACCLALATLSLAGCGALLGVDFDEAYARAELTDAQPADAPDAGPASPSFCDTIQPAPYFCADFEEELRSGWFELSADLLDTAGGKGVRGEVDPDSPEELGRYVARFSAPALLTKEKLATAFLVKQLPRVSDLAINFQMRIVSEQFQPGGRVELLEIGSGEEWGNPSRRLDATLLMTRTVGGVTQSDIFLGGIGGEWLTHDEFDPLPVNVWRKIQIVALPARSADGGTTEILVRVDNEIQSRRTLRAELFASPITLMLGIVAITGPADIFRVEFDNVRVDLTPAE